MTIAACFVLPEGIVVAADSTTTTPVPVPGKPNEVSVHYYDHGQKIFEVGHDSTIGVVTWGLGGLENLSWRTMIAELGDDFEKTPPASMSDAATRWADRLWSSYAASNDVNLAKMMLLAASQGQDPVLTQQAEEMAATLSVGFCLFGRAGSRGVEAYYVGASPKEASAPKPAPIPLGQLKWWGVPMLIQRLLTGVDDSVIANIMTSGKWTGTDKELVDILRRGALSVPGLPLRDAADLLHSLLHTTIKMLKFSHLPPVCGGPIEIAVITSDRPFRWIKHKPLDAAIS